LVIEGVSQKASDRDLDVSAEVLSERLKKWQVPNASVTKDGERLEITFQTGSVDPSFLLRPGRLEFFDLQGDLVAGVSLDSQGFPKASTEPLKQRPNTVVVTCMPPTEYCPGVGERPKRTYYYLFRDDPDLTRDDIRPEGTRQDFDRNLPRKEPERVVLVEFTKTGASKFEALTRTLAVRGRALATQNGLVGPKTWRAHQQFAIVLDGELRTAPAIAFEEFPDGLRGERFAQIGTLGSLREVREVALILQAGVLPIDFRVVSMDEART
jgi:preprotein translocase subunit SecD